VVKVGSEAKEYRLHKVLLTYYSEFFRGALASPSTFKEADHGIVELADVEPATFNIFVDMMYSGTIASIDKWNDRYPSSDKYLWSKIVPAYIFTDKYLVAKMENLVMDQAVQCHHTTLPWYTNITLAFSNLPENSPFQQLLVDIQCQDMQVMRQYETQESIDHLPHAFLYRVMLRQQEIHKSKLLTIRPRAEYNGPMEANTVCSTQVGDT
jgi:hypothetical protein